MSENRGTYEAYTGVELTTRSGVTVRGRALEFTEALNFMRLSELAETGDPVLAAAAINRLLDEFPVTVGLERSAVGPIEMLQEVLPGFLYLSGTARRINLPAMAGSPA